MAARLTISLKDYDGDISTTGFEGVTMTAGNFDAQITESNALLTAILAVTLGNTTGNTRIAVINDITVANPTNQFAQVNIQWIARYTDDTTGLVYTTRIPTADLAQATIMYNGAPALDLGDGGVGEALKDAWEAYVLHDGNPTTLEAVYFRE